MIDAYCRTNLDDFHREEWPDKFVDLPRVGDFVDAHSGARLRVCAVTHKFGWRDGRCSWHGLEGVPYIEVELHR